MQIYALRALSDNYIWVLVKDSDAIVVDAGQAQPVLDFLKQHSLALQAVLVTHHHHDHIGGIQELLQNCPNAQVFAHRHHNLQGVHFVDEGDTLDLLGQKFIVWKTAGHTDSHLSYLYQDDERWHVFCGDTLFSGGCGRVFTSTVEALFESFVRFNHLPEQTLFYPAHEYTLANLQFALTVAPKNQQSTLEQAIQNLTKILNQGGISLPTTLQKERQINMFLQTNDPHLAKHLGEKFPQYQHNLKTPLAVFTALRELKNQF